MSRNSVNYQAVRASARVCVFVCEVCKKALPAAAFLNYVTLAFRLTRARVDANRILRICAIPGSLDIITHIY